MSPQQGIVEVYVELVKRPYFFVVHSQLSISHARYDRYSPDTLREFMLQLFEILAQDRPNFMSALSDVDDREFMKSSQHRRYVAKSRELLYIKTPHLEKYAVQFRDFWIGTNVSHTQALSVVRMACEAAGVKCMSIRKLRSIATNP